MEGGYFPLILCVDGLREQVPNLHKENGSLAAIPNEASSISPIFQL